MAYSYAATVTTTPFGTTTNFTAPRTFHDGNQLMEDAAAADNWNSWLAASSAAASMANIMACQAMPAASYLPDHLAKTWQNQQVLSSPLVPNSPAMNNVPGSPMSPAGFGVHSTNGSPALNNNPGALTPTAATSTYEHYNHTPAAWLTSFAKSSQTLDPAYATPTAATAATWQGFPGGFQNLQTLADLQAFPSSGPQLDLSLEELTQEVQQQQQQQQFLLDKPAYQRVTALTHNMPEDSTLVQPQPISLTCDPEAFSMYLFWVGDVANDGTGDLSWLCGSSSASEDCVHAHAVALLTYKASL